MAALGSHANPPTTHAATVANNREGKMEAQKVEQVERRERAFAAFQERNAALYAACDAVAADDAATALDEARAEARLALAALAELPWEQSYTGNPGCMCGCRGNHSTNRGAVTAQRNRIAALLRQVVEHEGDTGHEICMNLKRDIYNSVWITVDASAGKWGAVRRYAIYLAAD